jgi:hypothetical protein
MASAADFAHLLQHQPPELGFVDHQPVQVILSLIDDVLAYRTFLFVDERGVVVVQPSESMRPRAFYT